MYSVVTVIFTLYVIIMVVEYLYYYVLKCAWLIGLLLRSVTLGYIPR